MENLHRRKTTLCETSQQKREPIVIGPPKISGIYISPHCVLGPGYGVTGMNACHAVICSCFGAILSYPPFFSFAIGMFALRLDFESM